MGLVSLLAAIWAAAAVVAAANPPAGFSCAQYTSSSSCSTSQYCQWFLNACVAKPQTDCTTIKQSAACAKAWGCHYYPDPQWWLPTKLIQNNYGNFHAPPVGCDTATMCDRLVVSPYCNKYPHCTWVDGSCQTSGTKPDPNWVPNCAVAQPRLRQYCVDQGPGCRYVNMKVCDSKNTNCQNVNYGCHKSSWCSVNSGPYLKTQCANLGDRCTWLDNSCVATPTASPTFAPTDSPTKRPSSGPTKKPTPAPTEKPTVAPTPAPTNKPTSLAPTKLPTTHAPTPPTTNNPTLRPTPPTTVAPTLKPTTAAPTVYVCPHTITSGALICPNHPFAELDQTFPVPFGNPNPEGYCNNICANGGAAGSFGIPVFPGCRAFTYDGTTCRMFGCWPDGTGNLQGTIVATAGTVTGVLSATCFGGNFATQAPTSVCTYTNTANPPATITPAIPIDASCRIGNATMSTDYVGTPRNRLDWCQESCTNNYDGCIGIDLYGVPPNGGPARCVYVKCKTLAPTTIARTIYRSFKTVSTC